MMKHQLHPSCLLVAIVLVTATAHARSYTEYAGYNCYAYHGATDLESTQGADCGTMDRAECEAACDGLDGCTGITFGEDYKCYRRADIVLDECDLNSFYNMYIVDDDDDGAVQNDDAIEDLNFTKFSGYNCYADHGATDLESSEGSDCGTMSLAECEAACDGLDGCTAVTYGHDSKCYRRADVHLESCDLSSDYDMYIKDGTMATRLASYFVLGDWGYDQWTHGSVSPYCQQAIADLMVSTYKEEGDVQFVINVGDSFYPAGVGSPDSDSQWQEKFLDVYGSVATDIPWYSVYGNHDYEGGDACGCSMDTSGCMEINANVGGWYMPDRSYYVTDYIDEYDIEIVAFDMGDAFTQAYGEGSPCYYTQMNQNCPDCYDILPQIYEEGAALMQERIEKSAASNLIIFSHYPTPYLDAVGLLDPLKTSSKNIEYYGGHTHEVVENFWPDISPNQEWLVGGGGGWGCDGSNQGFVLAHIYDDGTVSHEFKGVDSGTCCWWMNKHIHGNLTGETYDHK